MIQRRIALQLLIAYPIRYISHFQRRRRRRRRRIASITSRFLTNREREGNNYLNCLLLPGIYAQQYCHCTLLSHLVLIEDTCLSFLKEDKWWFRSAFAVVTFLDWKCDISPRRASSRELILSTYSRRNSQGITQQVTATSRYTRDFCAGFAGLDTKPCLKLKRLAKTSDRHSNFLDILRTSLWMFLLKILMSFRSLQLFRLFRGFLHCVSSSDLNSTLRFCTTTDVVPPSCAIGHFLLSKNTKD